MRRARGRSASRPCQLCPPTDRERARDERALSLSVKSGDGGQPPLLLGVCSVAGPCEHRNGGYRSRCHEEVRWPDQTQPIVGLRRPSHAASPRPASRCPARSLSGWSAAKAVCRCKADPPRLHCPYHQWTRKIDGKTVTRHLTEKQFARYGPWFADARQLRSLLRELEEAASPHRQASRGLDLNIRAHGLCPTCRTSVGATNRPENPRWSARGPVSRSQATPMGAKEEPDDRAVLTCVPITSRRGGSCGQREPGTLESKHVASGEA